MKVKDLRPKAFSTHSETDGAKGQWLHWIKTFTTFINKLGEVSADDKLNLLINHVDATVYELFSEAPDYDDAINLLTNTYERAPSPIFTKYTLNTCNQKVRESLDVYLQQLKRLSIDCNFLAISAKLQKEEAIRDAFISEILSNKIRQRLLEDHNLSL